MFYQFTNDENANVSQNTNSFPVYTTRDIENNDQNVTDIRVEESTNAELNYTNTEKRTSLTAGQCSALEKEFVKRAYIDRFRRDDLAAELKLSSIQVRVWFRNRRIKEMKRLKVNQRKNQTKMATKSTPTMQTVAENLTNQLQSSTNPMFGNLSHLMGKLYVTDPIDYCGNLAHDLTCCTKLNFQPIKCVESSYVGPMTSHYNISSSYMSSTFDYEYDFFSDYS